MSRSRTIVPIEVGHGIATAPLPTLVLVFVIQTDPVVDRSTGVRRQDGWNDFSYITPQLTRVKLSGFISPLMNCCSVGPVMETRSTA